MGPVCPAGPCEEQIYGYGQGHVAPDSTNVARSEVQGSALMYRGQGCAAWLRAEKHLQCVGRHCGPVAGFLNTCSRRDISVVSTTGMVCIMARGMPMGAGWAAGQCGTSRFTLAMKLAIVFEPAMSDQGYVSRARLVIMGQVQGGGL